VYESQSVVYDTHGMHQHRDGVRGYLIIVGSHECKSKVQPVSMIPNLSCEFNNEASFMWSVRHKAQLHISLVCELDSWRVMSCRGLSGSKPCHLADSYSSMPSQSIAINYTDIDHELNSFR
jgi:hypothetical protein